MKTTLIALLILAGSYASAASISNAKAAAQMLAMFAGSADVKGHLPDGKTCSMHFRSTRYGAYLSILDSKKKVLAETGITNSTYTTQDLEFDRLDEDSEGNLQSYRHAITNINERGQDMSEQSFNASYTLKNGKASLTFLAIYIQPLEDEFNEDNKPAWKQGDAKAINVECSAD